MTRKLATVLAFFGSLSLAAWAQTPAATDTSATAPATTKIGVVNLQAAVAYTNEGQRDLSELQKKVEPTTTELKNTQDEIEQLKKQLDATKDKLSDEERAKRVQAIEAKQKNFERKYEDFQNDVSTQQNEIFERILRQLSPVLDEYAKKNGFSLVVEYGGQNSSVLWAAESTDLTKALIDAYNVKSGVPAPPKPAATTTPAKKPAAGTK